MEYIEREAALNFEVDSVLLAPGALQPFMDGMAFYADHIKRLPAADVAPVRHGLWVLTTQPLGWRDEDCVECSECGEDFVLDEWGIDDVKDAMRYCPNCGAKMDGDGE